MGHPLETGVTCVPHAKVGGCLKRREGAGTLSNVREGQEVRTEHIHSLWSGGQW